MYDLPTDAEPPCPETWGDTLPTTDGELITDATLQEAVRHGLAVRIGDIIVGLLAPADSSLRYYRPT
jgi:hypothetical protein